LPHANTSMIRLATPSDAREIAELSRRLVEHGLAWRWQPQRIRSAIGDRDTVVIVKEVDRTLAGFALAGFSETTAHISLLAVNRTYQRLGIATEMLNWLIKSSRVAGIGRVNLEVRSGNSAAITCYQKLGFEQAGVKTGYYEGIEDATGLSLILIDQQQEARRPQ